MVQLTKKIVISEKELIYRFSRSSGPGGQNVNKLNTRVTLLFQVADSQTLTGEQKQRIIANLSSRISGDGFLTVVSQRHRTQNANRIAAQRRLGELLASALVIKRERKKTAVPYASRQRRLQHKRRRGEIKQMRKPITPD
ncbi:MAG: alternative ribosome rescue aminoacyl-tRNA hydrolase ArfB [Sedimentisphaerales bacterium]